MSIEQGGMFFPENPGWSHQIRRMLSEIAGGGGDYGEISRTASKITTGNHESWYSEWSDLAKTIEEIGREAESKGYNETASKSYFRSSNYYRIADFYLDRDDRRELPTFEKHTSLFEKAASLEKPKRIEKVRIPSDEEGKSLHGYFLKSGKKEEEKDGKPFVIAFGGADSTCEEVYFSTGADGLAHGFDMLLLDGPGQASTLRFEKLYARFDFEKALGAAIDFLPELGIPKEKRIGILGRSIGGYYASRAAAKEKRVSAAVIFDAIFNVLGDVYDYFPPVRKALNWDVGARTENEAREKLERFNLEGVASGISCPFLIIHGSEDYVSSPKGAEKLYSSIAHADKTLKWYKAGHGVAEFRAEAVDFAFDWLSEKLSA